MVARSEKRCTKCGETMLIFNKRSWCSICDNTLSKEYYHRHREERQKYAKEYSIKNENKIRQYYRDNKSTILEKQKQSRATNPDRINAVYKKYRQGHKNEIRDRVAAWRKAHPEKITEYNENRRANKNKVIGQFIANEWEELKMKYEYKCLCCGKPNVNLTVDHIIPISVGGPNTIDNIQPLCQSCNSSKSIQIIDYRE